MVVDLHTQPRRYYMLIEQMPERHRPALIVRGPTATLLTVDLRTTRLNIVAWSVDNLTVEEMNAYRAAYGEPPVGGYLSDHWMLPVPINPVVPNELLPPQYRVREST